MSGTFDVIPLDELLMVIPFTCVKPDFEHVWEQLKPYAPEKTLKATETFSNYMVRV